MSGRTVGVVLLVAAVVLAGCTAPGGDGQPREGPAPVGATPSPGAATATDVASDSGVEGTTTPPNVTTPHNATTPNATTTPHNATTTAANTGSPPRNATPTPPNATPTRAAVDVPPPSVDVHLNCTTLRVTVTPEAWHYRMYLRYRDTVTDRQRRIAVGLFTGTVTDHFGPTDFVLLAVEVRVTGFGPVVRTRPTRCPDETE